MSGMQRTKGQSGERELAALLSAITGLPIRRKVRQHDGDHDLEGLPGWAVEVKRHAAAPRASIASWWRQAVEQARRTDTKPVLFYRADRGPWRAVWAPIDGSEYHDTTEADPALWWAMSRPHSTTPLERP
jgi:hypothetical protein